MNPRLLMAAAGAVALIALAATTVGRSRDLTAPAQVVPARSFALHHAGDGIVRWVLSDGRVPGGPVAVEEGVVEGERGDTRVVKIEALHGAQVEVGTLLATIGSARSAEREAAEDAERRAREADLALVSRGGRDEDVRWARREVEVARAAVVQAKAQSERLSGLVASGAASAWEAQDAALQLSLREAELALATVGVDRAALAPRPEDLALAEAGVAAAAARLAEARAARAHERLVSPLVGRVDLPGSGIVLRVLGDEPSVLQIALDAHQRGLVHPGDEVLFQVGEEAEPRRGRIVAVGDEVRAVGLRAVVWLTASVEPAVPVGVTGVVRIRTGS